MARLLLLWFLPFALNAGPAIRVLELDSSRFPQVEILAELAEGEGAPQFTLRDAGSTITPSIIASRKEADRLVLAVVFDATGSIPAADYKRAQNAAGVFLSSLTENDRTALFQVNGGAISVSGFVPGGKSIADEISQLKRVGRTTRIFDALHRGISAARDGILRNQNTEPQSKQIAKAAVLLFTDGRDEFSYLNEQDCLELAELGAKLRVPVYTVLYGRPRNNRVFQRLSMRTGGSLITLMTPDSMKKLSSSIRLLNEETFRLSYRAPQGAGARDVVLSVKRGTTIDEDATRYTAPSVSAPPPETMVPALNWQNILVIVLATLLFIAAIVALILVLRERRAKRNTELVTVKASVTLQEEPPAEQVKLPEGEAEKVDIIEGVSPEDRPHPAVQYLRESAYRTLQEALRGAPRYEAASIVRKKDGMSREYDLFLENTVLGSGRWASVRVEDSGASRVQAKIKRVDGRYVLFDLIGGPGVYLNGKKVLRPRGLHDGDEIKMGRSVFIFRGKGRSQAAPVDERTFTIENPHIAAENLPAEAPIGMSASAPAQPAASLPAPAPVSAAEDDHSNDFLERVD